MPVNRKITGHLRRDDYWRAVVTDTSPFELPIIVSNDGFYKNLHQLKDQRPDYVEFVDKIINSKSRYQVPYRYNVVKESGGSVRTISLLHPASQVAVCKFYKRYDSLITYFCSVGSASVRHPFRRGSTFFFMTSDAVALANKYRRDTVDTVDIDKLVANPASYFAYRGYQYLYRFFKSAEYNGLEKSFSRMLVVDIARCFNSIYTHSLSWAVKGIEYSKRHTDASSFGNDFDTLMQKMNYNETNGICIGPEISRIFAEIIFNRVDRNLESMLDGQSIRMGKDYAIRRYVDNYYIFSNSDEVERRVESCLEGCLREYNLYYNPAKRESFTRPFYTTKSKVIAAINRAVQRLFEKCTETHSGPGRRRQIPVVIYNYKGLLQSFVGDVKAACFDSGVGYEMVSNYIIGALKKRLERLCQDAAGVDLTNRETSEKYVAIIVLILEIGFFLYSLHSTAASSLRLSGMIILSAEFFSEYLSDRGDVLSENVLMWTSQIFESASQATSITGTASVPVEFLNIMLAVKQFHPDTGYNVKMVREILQQESLEYFSIISLLYIFRDNPLHKESKDILVNKIIFKIMAGSSEMNESERAHLLLDTLSCPFVDLTERVKILHWTRKCVGLGSLSNKVAAEVVAVFEKNPWFVRWDGVSLRTLIRKKELRSVY